MATGGWQEYFERAKAALLFWLEGLKRALSVDGTPIELPRKHKGSLTILLLTIVLVAVGFVVIFSTVPGIIKLGGSSAEGCKVLRLFPMSDVIDCQMTDFLATQVVYLVIGVGAFLFAYRRKLEFWRKSSLILLIAGFGSSLTLWVFGLLDLPLAVTAGGATRWLNFGLFTVQPAEIMKFALLMWGASFLASAKQKGQLDSLKNTFLPLITIVLLGVGMVVMLQSDLSSGIVILGIILAQMILSGMRWRNIVAPIVIVGALGAALLLLGPQYRMDRVTAFLDTDCGLGMDLEQICSAMMSLGSGGLFGRGIGNSLSVFWVPQVGDDAVFSLVGETFGFAGRLAVLVIFVALLMRILRVAQFTESLYLRLILGGGFAWIAAQTVINIAAFTQSMPLTGITLPFISSGGSSLFCILALMGVIFAISGYTSRSKVRKEDDDEDPMRGRRFRRSFDADRSRS